MIFQLTNIKVLWTDKITLRFRPPFLDQTDRKKVSQMYLERPAMEADQSLLKCLGSHRTTGTKPKVYDGNKMVVGVRFVSIFNPIYFYQHLTMQYPHQSPNQLCHPEEESMPPPIKFFSQAIALAPDNWATPEKITGRFAGEGNKEYFLNTIISHIVSLHDILNLWKIRVLDGGVSDLTSISMEHIYPLSPLQRTILANLMGALAGRRESQQQTADSSDLDRQWQKYYILLGKPGTGKSQVLIRATDHAIQNEMSVLVALLAQGYTKIFLGDT